MRVLLAVIAATSLAGCAVGPDFQPPELALTPNYIGAKAIDTRATNANWWKRFHDPTLAALVDKAIAGNTDLAQARARIIQSRAAALGADASLLPSVDGTGE